MSLNVSIKDSKYQFPRKKFFELDHNTNRSIISNRKEKLAYPRAFVLIRGVFRFRKPFFLIVCCCWLEPSPLSFWSSRSSSRCLDFLARRQSHIANASPTRIARAPTVPKTAVSMTSRRSMPTWNAQESANRLRNGHIYITRVCIIPFLRQRKAIQTYRNKRLGLVTRARDPKRPVVSPSFLQSFFTVLVNSMNKK